MSYDADQILVGANGSVHVAPVGSTLPTDSGTALDAAFTDLGGVNENGASVQDAKTLQPIRLWQAFYAVRRVVTERDLTVTFALAQWNADTFPLAFGGGTITEPDPTGAPGEYKFTPPNPQDRDERAFVLEWQDGTRNYRLVVPRVEVTDTVNTQLVRTNNAELPITLAVNGEDGVDPWALYTDDPAFTPAP